MSYAKREPSEQFQKILAACSGTPVALNCRGQAHSALSANPTAPRKVYLVTRGWREGKRTTISQRPNPQRHPPQCLPVDPVISPATQIFLFLFMSSWDRIRQIPTEFCAVIDSRLSDRPSGQGQAGWLGGHKNATRVTLAARSCFGTQWRAPLKRDRFYRQTQTRRRRGPRLVSTWT